MGSVAYYTHYQVKLQLMLRLSWAVTIHFLQYNLITILWQCGLGCSILPRDLNFNLAIWPGLCLYVRKHQKKIQDLILKNKPGPPILVFSILRALLGDFQIET